MNGPAGTARRGGCGRPGRMVENTLLGHTTGAVYERPARSLLLRAHREIESMVLDRDTLHDNTGAEVKEALPR